ncbi:hypothetical protein TCON_1990 [Astathelohania contejeani]|uniref:Uncharacterized protein n=1 Tax=Astathelohania contejeani TaxID=164912 RepID=A0ABQ7HXA5_9MICR|nr:hypothetical protein TCON_1990 [Thelohania contejeani]
MEKTEIIHSLLSQGLSKYPNETSMHDINLFLRPLGFEAVAWYDKSSLVLKDLENKFQSSFWKQSLMKDVRLIIEKIIKREEFHHGEIVKELLERKWIEKSDDMLVLSKRFIIQNDTYIMSLSPNHKKCSICGILVLDGEIHSYCQSLINHK